MMVMARAWALLLLGVAPLASQSVLERTPNVEGVWASRPGTVHFHFLHRFMVLDPPIRKVVNSPTFLVAAGLPGDVLAGMRYASNSPVVPASPNEWEVFGRAALTETALPVDVAVQAGWNGTAESADGEVVVGWSVGSVRLIAGARAFSAFRSGDGRAAWLAGGRIRLQRFVGVSVDAARALGDDAPDLAWSAGLQLEIPYTPHSLSLHVSNAPTTTLQGSTIGGDNRLYGFEFTIPVTLSRYFGSGEGSAPAAMPAARSSGEDVVVEMTNRLEFMPDTVRVKAGSAVVWRNGSALVHTVTADPSQAAQAAQAANVRLPAGASPFDSGDIVPGAEFRHVFEVAGEYVYFCIPHEMAGMTGMVIVER